MPYIDTPIMESDAPGLFGNDFDCVVLSDAAGGLGLKVYDAFGMVRTADTDVPKLERQRTRLVVVVKDPTELDATTRVRSALQWRDGPPF